MTIKKKNKPKIDITYSGDGSKYTVRTSIRIKYPGLEAEHLYLARRTPDFMEDIGLNPWQRVTPTKMGVKGFCIASADLHSGRYCFSIKIPDTIHQSWEFVIQANPHMELQAPHFFRINSGQKFEIQKLRSSH